MKLRAVSTICLFVLSSFYPALAGAELSVSNKWRIEQSVEQCGRKDNVVNYPEYWKEGVPQENPKMVCMAERFSELVALEGNGWLDNKAPEFIRQCRETSKKGKGTYETCLQDGLKDVARKLSEPCRGLAQEGLWDEPECRGLVSYIFIKDFDKVFKRERPLTEKMMSFRVLKYGFSPIGAFIFLMLYVLDLILLVDPGNWGRVPKVSLVVGTVILGGWFLPDNLRFLAMGAAVIFCAAGMLLNHISASKKKTKEKGRY